MKNKLVALLCIILPLASVNAAVTIQIGSSEYSGSLSNANPIPEGFSFALGSFGGFVPTAGNTNLWSTNWQPLSLGSWTAFNDFDFSGQIADGNPVPFTIGGGAYLWGYNSQSVGPGTEWILVSNPTWVWPNSTGVNPSVTWGLADLGPTSSIIGNINNSADTFQTAAIPEPTTMALLAGSLTAIMVLRRRRRS